MGTFYILGASGKVYWPYDINGEPDEWLKCMIRIKELHDAAEAKENQETQETQTLHPRQEVGQTLFGGNS
jgi:hypothetical protein